MRIYLLNSFYFHAGLELELGYFENGACHSGSDFRSLGMDHHHREAMDSLYEWRDRSREAGKGTFPRLSFPLFVSV